MNWEKIGNEHVCALERVTMRVTQREGEWEWLVWINKRILAGGTTTNFLDGIFTAERVYDDLADAFGSGNK